MMYTLKTKHGLIGYKSYVIGFENPNLVRKVSRILQDPPNIRMERAMKLDITKDVQIELAMLGVKGASFSSITIDVDALVYIPKNTDVYKNIDYDIESMDKADFLFMGFEKNLGLIMPYLTHAENDEEIVFKANIIDPSFDYDNFKKGLEGVL